MFCTRKTIWNNKNSQNGRKWLYWKPFFTTIYFKHWYSIELLSPLSQSVFDVKNTEAFIQEFKNMLPPDDYNLISFDVTSLFKNVLYRLYHQYHFEANLWSEGIIRNKDIEKRNERSFATTYQSFPMIINCIVKRMVLQWGHP